MKQWQKISLMSFHSILLLCMWISIHGCNINKSGCVVGRHDGEPMRGASVKAVVADRKDSIVVTTAGHYPPVEKSGFKPFQYDNGDDYVSDGCYRIVDNDGKIGYATENNVVIISPRFAFGFPFENGRAKVTDSGHPEEVEGSGGEYHYWISDNWYWIDKMGNRLGMESETDR